MTGGDDGIIQVGPGTGGGTVDGDGGDGGDTVVDLARQSDGAPTIVGPNGIEVTPVYVKHIEWTGTSSTTVYETRCGETFSDDTGSNHFSPTIEGMLLKTELQQLLDIDPEANTVELQTPMLTTTVSFDKFVFTEKDELNEAKLVENGTPVTEPVVTFQLQTEEEDEESGGLFG